MLWYFAISSLVIGGLGTGPANGGRDTLAAIEYNDNLRPSGTASAAELTIALEVVLGQWHVLGPDRPAGEILAFGEVGKTPSIPGPLLRVPLGTVVRASVTNRHDVTLVVRGLSSRRNPVMDSLVIPAGETREARFTADVEGTYYYWAAEAGVTFEDRNHFDSQLHGAFVVDPLGTTGPARDRVLVLGRWVQAKEKNGDPDIWTEFFVINGRPWPNTERFTYDVGDSVRWRVVNATNDVHPLHLHGFYFRVDARGDVSRDTTYWASERRMAVTERVEPGQTMSIAWSPDRPGGWIFHCHLNWHVVANPGVGDEMVPQEKRIQSVIDGHPDHDPDNHVETGMGGLMLAMYIRPPAGYARSAGNRRILRLFVQTDSTGVGAEGVRRYSYVLQDGGHAPAPDSVLSPSSTLVLHKGEPTSIWVFNRTPEPTQVHWHGVELDSPFDGVVGVGGFKGSPTPPIMPADSFEVRVTPPRSGSFMYHTHVNDIRQMSRGLWGAILILEPGESWNPSRDLVYQAGEGTDLNPVLNGKRGKDAFPPLTLQADERYRMRFMNISMGAPNLRFLLARDGAPVQWTPIAKDGFDLPAWQSQLGKADRFVSIGETMDVEVKLGAGIYSLELRQGNGNLVASQELKVLAWQTAEQQIASAVLPMPERMRAGATVLGYREVGALVELRRGTNGMICLADDPMARSFHVACYHEAMEPFMARGRALREEGVTGAQVDTVRFREVTEGKLPMPKEPAALWTLSGGAGSWNAETNEVKNGQGLYVVYIPFATSESTGLPAIPAPGVPWLMFPGTPKAHIMFIPNM
jgi:FtsP/CotA-like multicopper oxidase with cupredoxin domain